ncbi:MAG: CARDB domain-containing protein [Betaproteobacteria bacterium]
MRTRSLQFAIAIAFGIAVQSLGSTAEASPPKKAPNSSAARALTIDPQVPASIKSPAHPAARHPALANAKLLGAPPLPDLVPAPYFNAHNLPDGFPGIGFCDPNPAGGTPDKIRFRLANHGGSLAPASVVRVDFNGGGSVFANAPALMPGAETSGAVNIPQGCFPPGFSTACQFTVNVDGNAQVAESQEANNAVQSFCVGPAG